MNLCEWIKIEDSEVVAVLKGIRDNKKLWRDCWKNEAKALGFTYARFEQTLGCLSFYKTNFIGFSGPTIQDLKSWKEVKKGVYLPRVHTNEFKLVEKIREQLGESCDYKSINSYVFSKNGGDNSPISDIYWSPELEPDCIVMRLSWFINNRDKFKLSSFCKVIKESESLRLRGR